MVQERVWQSPKSQKCKWHSDIRVERLMCLLKGHHRVDAKLGQGIEEIDQTIGYLP